jgi:putative membrane protein
MIAHSLATLPAFLAYFAGALALTAAFLWVYMRVTPWDELRLIGAGNPAAAISLAGALLGFVMPLASVIAHAANWLDMVVWGIVALAVQSLVCVVARITVPGLALAIETGKVPVATALAAASLAVGLLNAACITW